MKTMHASLCVGQMPFYSRPKHGACDDPADDVFEFLR